MRLWGFLRRLSLLLHNSKLRAAVLGCIKVDARERDAEGKERVAGAPLCTMLCLGVLEDFIDAPLQGVEPLLLLRARCDHVRIGDPAADLLILLSAREEVRLQQLRRDPIRLCEYDLEPRAPLPQHAHPVEVDGQDAPPAVDEHVRGPQLWLSRQQVVLVELPPLLSQLSLRLRKPVSREVDEHESIPDLEEVESLRAPRGLGGLGQLLVGAGRDGVYERGLAHVRAPRKGDLQEFMVGKVPETRRRLDERGVVVEQEPRRGRQGHCLLCLHHLEAPPAQNFCKI
mmetsp:Transcript_46296/g.112712  ORF Transcript_46296/g.112712 Transcript_46296/m.112712 type:complete len:285 (+) Transcript_46296:91-945(+)